VAVVQYTFTHKQYTQHNETEYPEWNIHNNNIIKQKHAKHKPYIQLYKVEPEEYVKDVLNETAI